MTNIKMGTIIRTYRKQLQLKQDDLAVGICTTSYLSRIENNLVEADQEVYRLLLERLGQDYEALYSDYYEKERLLRHIYSKLLDDLPLLIDEVKFLESKQSISLHTMHQLVYIRYLFHNQQIDKAAMLIQSFDHLKTFEHTRETELWIAVSTYFYLYRGEYQKVLEIERNNVASRYFAENNHFEKAIYYYNLAFAAHRSYKFNQALYFIQKSIALFTHQYKPLFQFNLYSMHGVILTALSKFEDAKKEYDAAIQLLHAVPAIATEQQWSSIYNNLGFCYESCGQYLLAQQAYQDSISFVEDLHTVINFMRVLLLSNKREEVLTLQTKYPLHRFTVQHHQNQWILLECLANVDAISVEQFSKAEEPAMKSIIQEKHIELILTYAPKLAEYYSKQNLYKKSAAYYKLAYETSQELRMNG